MPDAHGGKDVSPAVRAALTNPRAWEAATEAVRDECAPHIDDAFAAVWRAPDRAARRAMLDRLPPHVRDIVAARVAALWGGRIVFATDDSADGMVEAQAAAMVHNLPPDSVKALPLDRALWVVARG